MDTEKVLIRKKDGFAWLILNNLAQQNALSVEFLAELSRAIDNLESDASVRAVLVTGSGKVFIAGADISLMRNMTADEALVYAKTNAAIMNRIAASGKIYIAAINGYALGGGCEFALACDMRIASDKARLGLPETTLGILPGAGGTQRLPRLVGAAKAMELVLSGEVITAEDAFALGVFNKVVPGESLTEETEALAERILRAAPLAARYAKECIRQSMELSLSTGLHYEQKMFALCFSTTDQTEGMTAFLEKRKAVFTAN